MNQENKRPVTLEDILRLKRAERPAAEFWVGFDRALREKQLAALVEKRPWWRTVSQPLFGLSRYYLPSAAVAVLAITFVATRDDRSAATAPAVPTVAASESAVPAMEEISAPTTAALAATTEIARSEPAAVEMPAPSDLTAPADVTRLIAGTFDPNQAVTPSARMMAGHFKIAQDAEPAIARSLFTQTRGFELRALPARATPPVEPLAQMAGPSSLRNAKFSSALAFSSPPKDSARASERVARRLTNDGDDRLYETVSRIKPRGNREGFVLGIDM